MIVRVSGMLEWLDPPPRCVAALRPCAAEASGAGAGGGGIVLEVMLPAFVARRLVDRVGQHVSLHTLAYLESHNQGASFTPRLIGFMEPAERQFFELFTTVKGIGNRRALRALAEPVGEIASAVERGDAKALSNLPEIGKRMAETVIAELRGKLVPFVGLSASGAGAAGSGPGSLGPGFAGVQGGPLAVEPGMSPALGGLGSAGSGAVEAMVRLGESRGEAERKVVRAAAALAAAGEPDGGAGVTVEALLSAALGAPLPAAGAGPVGGPARGGPGESPRRAHGKGPGGR